MKKKKSGGGKKYRLTVNKEQLMLISNCLEDCHRFMAGQLELSNSTAMCDDMHELHDELRKLHRLVVPELNAKYGSNASYSWSGGGCPNEYQRKFIASTYYLYREILHFFEKERKKTDLDKEYGYSVYNSPTLTCEDSGDPIDIETVDV